MVAFRNKFSSFVEGVGLRDKKIFHWTGMLLEAASSFSDQGDNCLAKFMANVNF